MTFGAPSHQHHIDSRLVAAIHILEVDAECIVSNFLLTFADTETRTSETHLIKCSSRLHLGTSKWCIQVYSQVVRDEISAK